MNHAALGLNVNRSAGRLCQQPALLIRLSLHCVFIHRNDLEIVADRFQNKCFVDPAGRLCRAVAQLVLQGKRHPYTVSPLLLDRDIAHEPEMSFRPLCRVVL